MVKLLEFLDRPTARHLFRSSHCHGHFFFNRLTLSTMQEMLLERKGKDRK